MSQLEDLRKAYERLPRPAPKQVGDLKLKVSDNGILVIKQEGGIVALDAEYATVLFHYMKELGFK